MTENDSGTLQFESPEQENARLREENARLRRLLVVHSIAIPQLTPANPPQVKTAEMAPVDKEERARKRIALFRSLFRGREDVYARRWENADGRSGYVPAAIKDWRAINTSALARTCPPHMRCSAYEVVCGVREYAECAAPPPWEKPHTSF